MDTPDRHHPTTTSRRLGRTLGCLCLVALTACGSGGGSESGGTDPDAEAGDQVDADVTFDTAPSVTEAPVDPAGDAATPTTSLVPSDAADLPVEPPPSGDEEEAPVTTLPGPLPTPSIRLIEVAQFTRPTGIADHPSDNRLFVVEQGGRVVAVDDESSEVVLDISDRTEAGGEQGLLGLAFHPDRDLAYVNYTDDDGNTVIAEFTTDPATTEFDDGSFREVLTVEQPFSNHNGGAMAFGPDGLLYVGLGDGGAADDPLRAGLDLSSRLGKILRIDPVASGDEQFTVPDDNPFVGAEGADPTIWSYGLRNPWRFSFDPLTGDLWIADVGQNEFEEINRAQAVDGRDAGRGLSFGWSAFEANSPFNDDQPTEGHTAPVVEYDHDDGRCSVSGGVVARQSLVDDLDGWYVYGDYCSGTIWGFDTTSPPADPVVVELGDLAALTSVAVGPEGELYAVSEDGPVVRLTNV